MSSNVVFAQDQGPEVSELRSDAEALWGGAGVSHSSRVDRRLVASLAEGGFLGRIYPVEYGGLRTDGISAMELCRIREAIATVSVAVESAFALQGLGAYPILQSGDEELKRRWLPDVARGRSLAAFALTEPEHGSDAAALSCAAEPDGEGFRISGRKVWISNAPDADVYTLFARTAVGQGARGVTAFVVPGDAEGLSGSPMEMISPHPIGSLELDGVFVPRSAVLGEVNQGFKVAMRTLDLFRPSVGACAVGMGQRALELSVERASSRHAFGVPISTFQGVSHPLADMATRLQAARLLVREAARSYDEGNSATLRVSAARAKLFATETAQFAVDAAIQIHGASALEAGHPLEDLYRAVRSLRIYEGTSEIQRNIISRELIAAAGAVQGHP